MKLKTLILAAILLVAFIAPAFSQEMPASGTTIDKNNYKKYAHLFPEEFLPAFETGWGILQPIKVSVVAQSKIMTVPKAYIELSAKNKGKYAVDGQGRITGGWAYDGMPFPDLQKNDKDFINKFMWNYLARYWWDDDLDIGNSYEKRKGEDLRWNSAQQTFVFFKNRLVAGQKPLLNNPAGLFKAHVFQYVRPDSVKNTMTLSYRYADLKKGDETYLYLPSMRRVLRAEAGQRSTPITGSTQALDDFNCFDGYTYDFSYSLVKEQKVLILAASKLTTEQKMLTKGGVALPFPTEGYEARDTYVIDIKPKDPRYPQSKKRIWIDKESYNIYYAASWDRAGKIWKVWSECYRTYTLGNDTFQTIDGILGVDTQFGMGTYFPSGGVLNTGKYTYSDVTPQSLLIRAR